MYFIFHCKKILYAPLHQIKQAVGSPGGITDKAHVDLFSPLLPGVLGITGNKGVGFGQKDDTAGEDNKSDDT